MSARPVSMDLIYIRNLKIDCVIGAFEWERRIRQTVAIDLDLAADVVRAAQTDRLADTVDYKAIAKRLVDYVGRSEFQLVETLAQRVAEIVLQEFGVEWVRVRINKKGALRGATDVGVVIERGRKT
jgi:dihydroneopterin aldolase